MIIHQAWDPWNPIDPKTGKKATTEAAKLRAQAEDRRIAIAAIGWPPEPVPCVAEERYVYRTGELWTILRELGHTVISHLD